MVAVWVWGSPLPASASVTPWLFTHGQVQMLLALASLLAKEEAAAGDTSVFRGMPGSHTSGEGVKRSFLKT